MSAGQKMNRGQRRRFEKWLRTPEGKAKVASLQRDEQEKLAKARALEAAGQKQVAVSPVVLDALEAAT